jgi:hypothetical protein
LHGVFFSDVNNGTAVGANGTILRTTDGGSTWLTQFSGTGSGLGCVYFSDTDNGTVAGGEDILRTTNSGVTWIEQTAPWGGMSSVSFFDANNGIGVGYTVILRTTNGGVTFIGKDNNITNPNEFILSQNFPNPFNPNTTINFSVPKQSNVTIKVYNILGKEILTLVNETKPQGNYKVEFNADNLSSGVYFYRMKTNEFTQTKKMLLVK